MLLSTTTFISEEKMKLTHCYNNDNFQSSAEMIMLRHNNDSKQKVQPPIQNAEKNKKLLV